MRRYICYIFCLLALVTALVFGVGAVDGDLVVDRADLLTSDEEEALRSMLHEISDKRFCDIVVVTVDSLDGKALVAYADDFYDYGGYADDGILLLVCMETRNFHITTTGTCEWDVTETAFDAMEEAFLSYLSDGEYYAAFSAYATVCDTVLDPAYADDYTDDDGYYDDYYDDYDYDDDYDYAWSFGDLLSYYAKPILISLLVGFLIAFCIVTAMKNKLKSVRTQVAAHQYIREGSMMLSLSHDNFLYRNVTRVARPKDEDSSGGHSGGSHHTSSSGRSHGGRSGGF